MIDYAIYAEMLLTDCSGELWVNGIPIEGEQRRRPTFEVGVSVHQLLVPGTNTLELVLDVEGPPHDYLRPRTADARPTAQAVGRLIRYPAGVLNNPENGRLLAEISYDGSRDKETSSPRRIATSVDLGPMFGDWSWQSAPVMQLDDITRREAESVLEDVHAALFSGNADRMLSLIRVKWTEADRAYPGRDDARDRANHAAFLSRVASDPRRMIPLDRNNYDFRLVAGGRILECINTDFMPSIRIAQEVEPNRWAMAPYAVSLARVGPNGQLAVVR